MKVAGSIVLLLGVLIMALGGLEYALPGSTPNVLSGLRAFVQQGIPLLSEAKRRADLERIGWVARVRLSSKLAIIQHVGSGRFTLLEAANRLRDLDRRRPVPYQSLLRAAYPSDSEAEFYCRQLLAGVEAYLEAVGGQRTRLLERLQQEWHEAFGSLPR
jgi:hypothetical protein